MVSNFFNLFLAAIFLFSFCSQMVGLPPLVGFLLSGFCLPSAVFLLFGIDLTNHSDIAGQNVDLVLSKLSEMGVSLLLFSIGLKLKVHELFKKESLGISIALSLAFSLLSASIFSVLLYLLPLPEALSLRFEQSVILGFALSFSSTVLAMKCLNERGESGGLPGRMTTSILVLQDVIAVAYLVLSTGHIPSPWAILVPAVYFIVKPWSQKALELLGRSELLTLGGLCFALMGGAAFERLGLHGDLGALVLGCMFAGHDKSQELASRLAPIKDMLLICYFLQLGFKGLPCWAGVQVACLWSCTLVLKAVLLFALFKGFRFRTRTSLLATFYLTNFSEFGLLVASSAVEAQKLSSEWLSVVALATAFSFAISKPLEMLLPWMLRKLQNWFQAEDNQLLNQNDQLISLKNKKVLILGMGRVGTGAYDELVARYGDDLALGIELLEEKQLRHIENERNVVVGDATDPDLWNRLIFGQELELILLTMSNYQANVSAFSHFKAQGQFTGRVAAIVSHEDERMALREKGIDAVFNVYNEAGTGFAMHLIDVLNLDAVWPKSQTCLELEHDDEPGLVEPEPL